MDKEKIKYFAQKILGCGCSEEVFKYIDYETNVKIGNIILKSKINIGNKLLIYIVEIISPEDLKQILPFLIEEGKKERNLKFNRFRLVLTTKDINEIKQMADVLYGKIDKDDKVYLHIIPIEDIPV